MDNEILRALRERRSCRSYKPEQITDDELKTVLEAGTWAPTAKAVQNPDLLQKISRINAAVWGRDIDPFYGAPTYVLVFGSDPAVWANSVPDGSLVLGNMMNAAHAIGLGSCWINREREMFATAEGKALMQGFGLPDGLIGIGALALGYPAGPARDPKPRKENYYRIVK